MYDWTGHEIAQKLDAFLQALHADLAVDDAAAYGALNGQNFLARTERLFPYLGTACAWTILQYGASLHRLAFARASVAAGQALIGMTDAPLPDGAAAQPTPNVLLARAEECYRIALALDPENAGAAFNLARLVDDRGQGDEAITLYGRAGADPWYRPHAMMRTGLILSARGDDGSAAIVLFKALALYDHFGVLHVRVAEALRKAGHIDEALAEFAKTVENRLYIPPEFMLRPPPGQPTLTDEAAQ